MPKNTKTIGARFFATWYNGKKTNNPISFIKITHATYFFNLNYFAN